MTASEHDGAGEARTPQVTVRFYAGLNDVLPPERRQVPFAAPIAEWQSVKDLIEALGVPHTEVDVILVNGEPVGFGHHLRPGDRISVYPVFTALDIGPLGHLRPPRPSPRFVLDTHLRKLAAYLRLLGFDTLYRNDDDDATLARVSADEGRILLTQDRGLLKRGIVTHGYLVRASSPREQLAEVVRRFNLAGSIAPFRRCSRCNGLLAPVEKEEIADRLEPRTRRYYDQFQICENCGQIYWPGSHLERITRLIERLRDGDA